MTGPDFTSPTSPNSDTPPQDTELAEIVDRYQTLHDNSILFGVESRGVGMDDNGRLYAAIDDLTECDKDYLSTKIVSAGGSYPGTVVDVEANDDFDIGRLARAVSARLETGGNGDAIVTVNGIHAIALHEDDSYHHRHHFVVTARGNTVKVRIFTPSNEPTDYTQAIEDQTTPEQTTQIARAWLDEVTERALRANEFELNRLMGSSAVAGIADTGADPETTPANDL